MTSVKHNYLTKAFSPNTITLGLGLQCIDLQGGQNSVPSKLDQKEKCREIIES